MKYPLSFCSVVLICSLLVANTQSAHAQVSKEDKIRQVESNLAENIQTDKASPMTIEARMAHYKIKGLSIAVIRDYKIEWAKGYGWADEALKVPLTDKTLFQAASISKSLNAVGVLKLVQEGKLSLNTDINTYLKSWKFPYDSLSRNKKITLSHLLSHTAGLSVHGFGGYEMGSPVPSVVQILDGAKPANSAAVRSIFEPGVRQKYSGGGTTISQMIVMDITGQSYDKFMNSQVLKPMGMTNSTFSQPPLGLKQGSLATGYKADGTEVKGKYHVYPEQGAAGLWTNPMDLAKYIIETQLANEGRSAKVLSQATTKLRLTPHIDKAAALGVFIEDRDGEKYFGHNGANEGFRSGYYGSLENGNGLVIMVNSDNGAIIQEIVNSIAKVYDFKGLNSSRVVHPAKVNDADLQSYTGNYQLTADLVLAITKEGEQLYAQATGQPKFPVYPETEIKFFFKAFDAQMEFVKDDKGNVVKMMFYQGGTIEAKKL